MAYVRCHHLAPSKMLTFHTIGIACLLDAFFCAHACVEQGAAGLLALKKITFTVVRGQGYELVLLHMYPNDPNAKHAQELQGWAQDAIAAHGEYAVLEMATLIRVCGQFCNSFTLLYLTAAKTHLQPHPPPQCLSQAQSRIECASIYSCLPYAI